MSPIVLAVAAGSAVWAILVVVIALLTNRPAQSSVVGRLGAATGGPGSDASPPGRAAPGAPIVLRRDARSGPSTPAWIKHLPRATEGFRSAYLPRLVRAGYHRPDQLNAFFAATVACPVVAVLLGYLLFGSSSVATLPPLLPVVLLGLMGAILPFVWLNRKIASRQEEIRETLPDALDLMSICLQAGLGMEGAMVRVGEELQRRAQPLGEEFVLTSLQIDAGRPRPKALQALALRCDLQEVRNLVMMLSQTERLGTGVAETLRTAADTMRTRRMQRAEATAAKTSVKTMFPVVLCMLPATLIVLAGPALLTLIRSMDLLGGF